MLFRHNSIICKYGNPLLHDFITSNATNSYVILNSFQTKISLLITIISIHLKAALPKFSFCAYSMAITAIDKMDTIQLSNGAYTHTSKQ